MEKEIELQNFSEYFYENLYKLRDKNIKNVFELLIQENIWKDKTFHPSFDQGLYDFFSQSKYLTQGEKEDKKLLVKYILEISRNITYLLEIENSKSFIGFYNQYIKTHIGKNYKLNQLYEIFLPKIFYRLFSILNEEKNSGVVDKELVEGFLEQNSQNFINPETAKRIKNSLFDIKNLLKNLPEKEKNFSSMKKHFDILEADLYWQEFLNIIENLNKTNLTSFEKNKIKIKINNLLRKINVCWGKTHPDKIKLKKKTLKSEGLKIDEKYEDENKFFENATFSKEIIFGYLKNQLSKLEN